MSLYLILGGISAAARASPNNTFYCRNVLFPFQFIVKGYLISVGVLLISCALLLCIFLVWVFVVEWLSKLRKCVYYTIASTVAVFATALIPCLVLSLFSVPGFFILALVHVCNSISSITMYDCNLVFFLWCIIGHLLMLWSCFCFLCSASLWALLLSFVKL